MDILSITGTSPAAAGTAAVGPTLSGLGRFRGFRIEALLVGATGGTLDVYIQRKVGPDLWTDWCHFTQLAAGAAAVRYALTCDHTNSTTVVTTTAGGTDATPAVALAAGTFVGGHPGDTVRVVCVAGASTSAGAALAVHFQGIGKP
jgi:hypothetical protein